MRLRRRQSETDDVPETIAGSDRDHGDFASVLDRELNDPTPLIDSHEPSSATSPTESDGISPGERDSGTNDSTVNESADEPADDDWHHPDSVDFWAGYDEACAVADLFAVPPAAMIAVVGPLSSVADVVDGIRRRHWDGESEVVLLTDRAHGACNLDRTDPKPWTVVRRPDDLVATLDHDKGDAPLLVIDVPGELPNWIRSLIGSLRSGGLGLVHYVLDGDPTDEDLATWHGQLGRPSVLDLASPIEPDRAMELLDRGEPIASISGVGLSAELLLALKMESQPDV